MSSYRRFGVVSLGAALALLANISDAGVNSWTIKGPPGGMFQGVRASSTDSSVFYAIYSRSVHRSTDGGVTWTILKNFASQVNGLAVDPTDGNRLYVTALDHGLFRSDDRGQSFIQVAPAGAGVWGVGTNGATVYYAMGNRVYRSDDRGQSWSAPGIAPQTLTRILVDPQDSDVVYSFSGATVIRSTDGGITWSDPRVNPDPESKSWVYDIAQLSATRLIVACNDGLWISNDRGVTWHRTSSGSFASIAVDPSTPGRAVATNRGVAPLQVTTNYGATWSTLGNLPTLRYEGASFDATVPTRIVVLGQQGALYSNNDAQTWTEAALSPVASSPTQFATTLAANSRIYTYTVGGGGGLFATSGAADWQRLNLAAAQALHPGFEFGQASLAVKPGSPSSIFFGVFNRGVFRSIDGGRSWLAPNADLNGFSPQVFAFDPQDANTMYVNVYKVSTTPSAGIYRSSDGGVTWLPYSTHLPTDLFGMDMQVDPADPSRMFLAAYQGFFPDTPGGLYRSLDRGLTWSQSFTRQDVYKIAIDPSNSSRVYVATENGLQVSDDGGDSFIANNSFAVIANDAASSIVIDPAVPTTIYAASLDPGYSFGIQRSSSILRSVDAGATWEVLRAAADDGGPWYVGQLVLDPNRPSLIHAGTGVRGAAAFEVSPDLQVEIGDHGGTRPRGYESTFNVRAVNKGPYHATAVKLSAVVPAELTNVSITTDLGACAATTCTIPVLRVGEEVNAVVRYTTPASALFIPVTATIAAHENDSAAGNNSAQASAVTGDPGDLGIALTPSTTSVTQGRNVTYTVTVTNRGTTSASDGTVGFQLGSSFTLGFVPGGCSSAAGGASCTLGRLAPGEIQAFSFTAVATSAGPAKATANVAFGPSMADINPADNEATSSVTATTPAPWRGGGGGGGAMDMLTLLGGLLLLITNRRSKRSI
ncbi:CARDB domain-containing protein [Peristeroidobacter agariperforans]|uniref:CARDB domain-containing protein n=1 Tax=Peristeroidobacter agariperforans TaxID=268404 RepID=UPI001300610E|nr:CARDB domain-containing protein [Peristeroidobacter agariperforans]